MSQKDIRDYLTPNTDEEGYLCCYLTVSLNKRKQFTLTLFPITPYGGINYCNCLTIMQFEYGQYTV